MDQSPAAAAQQLAFNKWKLFRATETGDTDTVVELLDCRGISVDIKGIEEKSLLHLAVQGGHVTTMRLLIRRGCDVDSVDGGGFTPLHWAAAMEQTKAVRELIRKGANKSVVAGIFGTPLCVAAYKGHAETVVAMLEEGCPLHFEVDFKGNSTALHWAAKGGHFEVVREMVVRGCDVNAVDADGCTPLHEAAAFDETGAVCELLKLGATKSVVAGMFGTPLHQAIAHGHLETVEALLEDRVCETNLTKHEKLSESNVIDASNSFGQTPVMWAVRRGQVEMFKVLISKGGAITDRDTHSLSTFEHCFVGGHASKLSQFCEACDIGSSGKGLRGALATLITKGLVDAHKVLCLCAICGDSVFLEDKFSALVASDACAMPVECTMVELRGKIVSELGGAHQVSVQCCVLSKGAVWCAVWRRQVFKSCVLVLFCLLFSSFLFLLPSNSLSSSVSLLFPLCSQVSPQLASSSRSLVHIERAAELSWPLAQQRRTSDDDGTRLFSVGYLLPD